MRIGFIGLGNMGGPMAMNLIKAGHDLTVHDLRREIADPHLAAGATWADSVQGVAEAGEIVFTSLPGPPRSRRSPSAPAASSNTPPAAASTSTSPPTRRR